MPLAHQKQLSADLLKTRGREALLSLDPFEPLTDESIAGWRSLRESVDLLFVSEDEIASPGMRIDPVPHLRGLLGRRLRTIFYKQGQQGGLVLHPDPAPPRRWPGRAHAVIDATGAGDAFACGVLAGLIHGADYARALAWGVVSASFAIQGQGVEGLLATTPEDAQERLESWFGP